MSKTMCRTILVFNLELYVCECEVMFVNVNTYVN
jgi:hypothetical protein